MIQVEGEIYWEVDNIAFWFYWTIINIFAFLNIHHWLKIANITPHGPNDDSVEPKRYSVDLSINLSFHLDRCYQFFYILSDYNPLFTFHIYIYIYICIVFFFVFFIEVEVLDGLCILLEVWEMFVLMSAFG